MRKDEQTLLMEEKIQKLEAILEAALLCLVGIYHFVLLRTYQPVAEAMVRRQLDNMKKKKQNELIHQN